MGRERTVVHQEVGVLCCAAAVGNPKTGVRILRTEDVLAVEVSISTTIPELAIVQHGIDHRRGIAAGYLSCPRPDRARDGICLVEFSFRRIGSDVLVGGIRAFETSLNNTRRTDNLVQPVIWSGMVIGHSQHTIAGIAGRKLIYIAPVGASTVVTRGTGDLVVAAELHVPEECFTQRDPGPLSGFTPPDFLERITRSVGCEISVKHFGRGDHYRMKLDPHGNFPWFCICQNLCKNSFRVQDGRFDRLVPQMERFPQPMDNVTLLLLP